MRIRLTGTCNTSGNLKFNVFAGATRSIGVVDANLPKSHSEEIEEALNAIIPQHMQDEYHQLHLDERAIIEKRRELLLQWELEVIPIVEQFVEEFTDKHPELLI